jgi:lysozyme family protein
MADFQKALAYTLKHEGGWSDDPADPGGATMQGITLATARNYGIETREALRAISQEKVAEIYGAGYWLFGQVDDQRVATKLFDMAVNMGAAAAVKILQLAVLAAPDGKWGPKTLAATNAADPKVLLAALCRGSAERYRAIVEKRPASAKFLKGWLRRAAGVPDA